MEKKFSVKKLPGHSIADDVYNLQETLDLIDIAMAVPGAVMVIEYPDNSRFIIKEVK